MYIGGAIESSGHISQAQENVSSLIRPLRLEEVVMFFTNFYTVGGDLWRVSTAVLCLHGLTIIHLMILLGTNDMVTEALCLPSSYFTGRCHSHEYLFELHICRLHCM